jgi:hypothetical protein
MNAEILTIIGTGIGTGITIIGFLYTVIHNFRKDMDDKFDKSEQKWIETNKRMDLINNRMDGVYHILLKRIKE